MNNATSLNELHQENNNSFHIANWDFYKSVDWILPIVIEIILITASSWILVSLVNYGIKTGKWNHANRRNSEKLKVGHIFTSIVVCVIGCIVHPVMGIVYMSVGFNGEDALCETFGDLMACAYGFAYLALLMFLWLRQRVFFTNQMLNVEYSKRVKWFSAVSIIVIYVVGGAVMLFLIIPFNQKSSHNGCLYFLNEKLQIVYWISSFAYVMFGELSLVSLFIYAIFRSGKDVSCQIECFKNTFNCSPCSGIEAEFPSRNSRRITRSNSTTSLANDRGIVRKILAKTLAVSVITVTMDFLFQAYLYYLADQDAHRRFSITYGSANLFFQLLLVISTFLNVKEMLFSFCVVA